MKNAKTALVPTLFYQQQKSAREFLYGASYRYYLQGSLSGKTAKTNYVSMGLLNRWKDAMIAKDLARLDAIITEAIAANDKMIRVCAFDQQGARLSTCRCHALSERPYPGERILETPIMVGDDVYGSVGVAFSAAHIERDIATVERNLYLVATILLGVTLIVAWLMGDTLSRQLQAIQHELVAEDPHELPTFPGRCEIDQVARSVNALIVKRRQEKFRADA